jgi:hypothetical protein
MHRQPRRARSVGMVVVVVVGFRAREQTLPHDERVPRALEVTQNQAPSAAAVCTLAGMVPRPDALGHTPTPTPQPITQERLPPAEVSVSRRSCTGAFLSSIS